MTKYIVYAKVSASIKIGEYEAGSKEEALQLAEEDGSANWMPSLCHQCSDEVDLGDAYDPHAELMD